MTTRASETYGIAPVPLLGHRMLLEELPYRLGRVEFGRHQLPTMILIVYHQGYLGPGRAGPRPTLHAFGHWVELLWNSTQ